MSRLTIRNLGLVLLTAVLFVALALLLIETLQPIAPGTAQTVSVTTSTASDTPPQKFGLRLDKTLQTPITSVPTATAPGDPGALTSVSHRVRKLAEPEFRKPLLFLAATLGLGLLSGIGLRRRTHVAIDSDSQVSSLQHTVSPLLDAPQDSSLSNENRQLNAEVKRLTESLQSYAGTAEVAEALQLQQRKSAEENQDLRHQVEKLHSELQQAIETADTVGTLREQLEHAQQQNALLESQLLSLDERLQEYAVVAEDADHLRKQQTQTAEQNSELLAEVQTLRDNLQSYENEINNTENRLKEREITIEELRDELQAADGLASTLQSTQKKQHAMANEITERDEIISNLHADIDNWRDQSASQEEHAIEMNDQLTLTREENERAERDIHAAEELINELQHAKESLISQVDQLEPRAALADDLSVQIENFEQSSQRLQNEYEQLQNTLLETQMVADESTRLQTKLSALIEELELAENANSEAEQQIQTMQQQQRDLELAYSDKAEQQLQTIQQQQRDLELAHSDKAEQLSQLSATINERDSTISQLSETIESGQKQFDELDQAQQALIVEHQALNENHAQLSHEYEQLENELATLKTILEETEQSNVELSESIVLLREDLTNMVNQVNERNALINEGKQRLAVEMHHATVKEQSIEDLHAQLADEAERREAMSDAIAHAALTEERLSTWDNSLQTYRNEISQKNVLIDELHDSIRISNIRNEALKSQIRSMDEQMEILSTVREEIDEVAQIISTIDEQLGGQETVISALSTDTTLNHEKIISLNQNMEQMLQEKSQWQVTLADAANATAELQLELMDNQQTFLNLEQALDQTMQAAEIESVDASTDENNDLAMQLIQKTQLIAIHLSSSMDAIQISIDEHNILQERFAEQVELNNSQRAEAAAASAKMAELQQEIEHKQREIDAQITAHDSDVERYGVRQAELENETARLSSAITRDQEAFSLRQDELQQQIDALKERENRQQEEAHQTNSLLASEQEKYSALTQEVDSINELLLAEREKSATREQEVDSVNELLLAEREKSATREQEIQRLSELSAAEKEGFSAQLLDAEQRLNALESEQEEARQAHEKQLRDYQSIIDTLEQEAQALEARIEANRQEFTHSLKANAEQLQSELKIQRDALLEKSHVSHQQLSGELLEQKEANSRLLKEIEAHREQIRQLEPMAQAVPVLRNIVAGGNKTDNVPVLRQAKNKKD